VDHALEPLEDAFVEARLASDPVRAALAPLGTAARIWRWAGHEVEVERFVVEKLESFGWDPYRGSRWSELRQLIDPCLPLLESLERRMLALPSEHLPHRAKCAQVLVFRAEADMDPAREWAWAERALAVCPPHRNARLVLAHLCCDRAIRLVDRTSFLTVARDLAEARALVARARELFPQGRRMAEAEARLARAEQDWGRAR
jgi:hypothetical protein